LCIVGKRLKETHW